MKPNKQKTDWVKEFYDKFVDTVHSIVDPTYSSEQVLSSPKRLTDFISNLLQQQREEIIKEIEGELNNLFDRHRTGKEKTIEEFKNNQQKMEYYLLGILASKNITKKLLEKK